MTNAVQLKRSSVAGNAPSAASLAAGELAVNFADKLLFTKDGSGNIIKVGSGTLAGLSDVNLGTLSNGDVLTYDAASGKWKNGPAGGVDLSAYLTTSAAASTYLTQSSASSTYLPLTGGTLASALTLTGTNGSVQFSTTGDQIAYTRNGFNYITASGASATLQIQASGASGRVLIATNGAVRIQVENNGAVSIPGSLTVASSAVLTAAAIGSTVQAYDADLTAIAALTGSSGFLKTNGAGTWSVDTATYAANNQTMYVGTTALAINRASASLSLTGVSIDGSAGSVAWSGVTGKPTTVSGYGITDALSASYLADYTSGAYRVIADYATTNTWFIRSNGRFTWARGHDWTQAFELNLESGTAASNNGWAEFGQRQSNNAAGTWFGTRFVQYTGSAKVDGWVRASRFYLGDDTNYITQGSSGAIRSQTSTGYIDIGSMNTSWAHIQTDRSRFYFGKSVTVDGDLQRYSDSAVYVHSATTNWQRIQGSSINYGSYGSIGVTGTTNTYAGISFSDVSGTLMFNAGATGFYYSNSTWRVYWDGSGNQINTGNVTAYSSDERLKYNVVPVKDSRKLLRQIDGVYFDWDLEECNKWGFHPPEHDMGLLAQRVQKIAPHAVHPAPFDLDPLADGGSKSGKHYLTVQYEKLVPLLVNSSNEHDEIIEKQEARIADLERRILELEAAG